MKENKIDFDYEEKEEWFWNSDIKNKFVLDFSFLRNKISKEIYEIEKEKLSLVKMVNHAKYTYPRLEEINDRIAKEAFIVLMNYWLDRIISNNIDIRCMEAISWGFSEYFEIFPANGFIDKLHRGVYSIINEFIKGKNSLKDCDYDFLLEKIFRYLKIERKT